MAGSPELGRRGAWADQGILMLADRCGSALVSDKDGGPPHLALREWHRRVTYLHISWIVAVPG